MVARRIAVSLVLLLVFCAVGPAPCPAADRPDARTELMQRLGLPENVEALLAPADFRPSAKNKLIEALHVAHLGGDRLLFKIRFKQPVRFASHTLELYLDLDNRTDTGKDKGWDKGADLRYILTEHPSRRKIISYNKAFDTRNTRVGVAQSGRDLYLAVDPPAKTFEGNPAFRACVILRYPDRKTEAVPLTAVQPARTEAAVDPLPRQTNNSIRLMAEYRALVGSVAFHRLDDKGLSRSDIHPDKPRAEGRPVPPVPFGRAMGQARGRTGSIAKRTVRVILKEESGVDRRHARVSFGFPLPKGGLYDTGHMMASDETLLRRAQFTPTSHWPDGSLRFVLVSGETTLQAGREQPLDIVFGAQVRPPAKDWPNVLTQTPAGYLVNTGPMQVAVNTTGFNVFEAAWFDQNGDGRFTDDEKVLVPDPRGIVLVDQQGRPFTTAGKPEKVSVEKGGLHESILRVEGHYTDADGTPFMRYVTRLRFRRGSTRFTVIHQHINDRLDHELTDVTSLSFPVGTPGGGAKATIAAFADDLKTIKPVTGQSVRLFQADDLRATVEIDGKSSRVEKASGLLSLEGGPSVVLHNLWQRYPKALARTDGGMVVELLPKQPGKDFGQDLPYWLRFPFCEGYYRMKWGMAFTERMTFDVNPAASRAELVAEAELPVVAVTPARWFKETEALGAIPEPRDDQFKIYDDFISTSFRLHMIRKRHEREYGFFNWGDWQGERGRNWGNNEYDLAHGLMLAFARTGRREFYRWALQAARHQVDSDLIHAYPDPYYVGANTQHSFGHHGNHSQYPTISTFSLKHDRHSAADNGHTWADGLVDTWCLSGDPVVMEGAIKLGEHISYAVAQPGWEMSLGWPRSAGWQLKAICAIHRARPDEVYLDAAARIAEEPLSKQDASGAWFPDWRKSVSNFQMGLMIGALATYHEMTGDARARGALLKAAQFMVRGYDETVGGWPAGLTPEARPAGARAAAGPHHNPIILNGLGYAARISGDDALARLCIEGLDAFGYLGIVDSFGKTFAMRMQMMEGLGHLQAYLEAARDDKGLTAGNGDFGNMLKFVINAPEIDKQFVRRDFTKTFYAKKVAEGAELVVERKIVGATLKDDGPRGLTVVDGAGKEVGRDTFDNYSPHKYTVKLPGAVGSVYTITVNDGTHGAWAVGGSGVHVVMTTHPRTTFRRRDQARVYFMVPEGTRVFSLKAIGAHQAPYGIVLLDPEGNFVDMHKSMNPGQALLTEEDFKRANEPLHATAFGKLDVKPKPGQTGKPWTLIYWGGGCVNLDLDGVPPYLAIRKEQLFKP